MIFGKYINEYYKKYWYLFVMVFLCDIIVDLVQLLLPMVIGNIITAFSTNIYLNGTYSFSFFRPVLGYEGGFVVFSDSMPFYQTDFFITLMFILSIGLIIFVGRMGWRFFSAQIAANIERDLRDKMFEHIQTLSLAYYNQKKVGGLLSFFTYDLQTIKQCFTDGMIFITDLLVLGSTSFTLMAIMSWQMTLYTAIPLIVFIIFGGFVGKAETKRYKISSDAFEDLSDFTEENLQGFSVVKSFLKEKARIESFKGLSKNAEVKSVAYLKFSSLIEAGINIFLALTFFILYLLAANSILNPTLPYAGSVTDVGKLTTYVGYYDALIWPMIAGGMLIDMVSRGSGARKRIAEILDSKADIIDDENPARNTLKGKVEFRDLSFTYPDGQTPSLKNISFVAQSGMSVGIIGRTGSGKSTLVSLLPKLFNLPRGVLFIDDVDINDWRKADLREHIGYVLQEGFLFSGTIKENIAFSEKETGVIDFEKVKEAARFANVEEDILSFSNQYDTIVGEKGATLSGGQRQRVSIARAIYKKPEVLILDDSLSAVDADTEKAILENIKEGKQALTTFIIAHRVSAVKHADLILVLDNGRLVGSGRHDELFNTCKLYHDLCTLQELEKEVK